MIELLKPQLTDVRFDRFREPGNPGSLCSRCLLPIGKNVDPILWFPASGKFVFRYHPACLGVEVYESDEQDLDDWEDL